jgi:hypothetical protein
VPGVLRICPVRHADGLRGVVFFGAEVGYTDIAEAFYFGFTRVLVSKADLAAARAAGIPIDDPAERIDAARFPLVFRGATAATYVALRSYTPLALLVEKGIPHVRVSWERDNREDMWGYKLDVFDGKQSTPVRALFFDLPSPARRDGWEHSSTLIQPGSFVHVVGGDAVLRAATSGKLCQEALALAVTLARVFDNDDIVWHQTMIPGEGQYNSPGQAPEPGDQRLLAWQSWLAEIDAHAEGARDDAEALVAAIGARDRQQQPGDLTTPDSLEVPRHRATLVARAADGTPYWVVDEGDPWKPTFVLPPNVPPPPRASAGSSRAETSAALSFIAQLAVALIASLLGFLVIKSCQ